ncbi:MAG: hypothetical protein ACR2GD_09510 [Pyrinomonadaceae bacterium]
MNIENKTLINGILAIGILLAVGLGCSKINELSRTGKTGETNENYKTNETGETSEFGTKLMFNGTEMYYTKNVTEAEARKLGNYMISVGFSNGQGKSVQLDKSGSTYQFRMVVIPEMQNNEQYLNVMKTAAAEISRNVFNNAPVEVHVCDNRFKTLRVITP